MDHRKSWRVFLFVIVFGAAVSCAAWAKSGPKPPEEEAQLSFAPEVPPPVARNHPVILKVALDSSVAVMPVDGDKKYKF